MNSSHIVARDIDDAWFQCMDSLIQKGRIYTIQRGSYEGQKRLEFDFVSINIRHPSVRPLAVRMPEQSPIDPPTTEDYIHNYLPYLLTGRVEENEQYTYGERLVGSEQGRLSTAPYIDVNQVEEVIHMLKNTPETNQACMEIGMPSDIKLLDPPCLRLIDCRVQNYCLHFYIYFRSWDLWGGLPVNLGGLQLLKEHMADEIGIADGQMMCMSKGLHLYNMYWEVAEMRTGRRINDS